VTSSSETVKNFRPDRSLRRAATSVPMSGAVLISHHITQPPAHQSCTGPKIIKAAHPISNNAMHSPMIPNTVNPSFTYHFPG